MKIKPSTLFLVLAAFLLGGVVLVVQSQAPPPQAVEGVEQEQPIFSFKEEQVQTLTLQTQLRSLKFERKDGKWQMIEPEKTAASDASIAFLLDLMATGKSNRTITVPAADQKDFGFDQPLATIEVKLDNQETHKLILGGYDFNRTFLYAQADPSAESTEDLKVLLVSPNFENAVGRPAAEWKQPTEAEKSAPESPSSSPTPSPSANFPETTESPNSEAPETESSPTPEAETQSAEPSPAPEAASEAESTDSKSTEPEISPTSSPENP